MACQSLPRIALGPKVTAVRSEVPAGKPYKGLLANAEAL